MSRSYIRTRYQHIAVSTPMAIGGLFCLSTAGYIYGAVPFTTVMASPFIAGFLSLSGWLIYEVQNMFDSTSKTSFRSSVDVSQTYGYVFRSSNLKNEVHEDRLLDFCKLGFRRQEVYLAGDRSLVGDFKPISKNTIWSEKVFLLRRFSSEEVWSCKYILWRTGQFINWQQGSAGFAIGTSPEVVVDRAKRRWKHR